MNLVKIQNKDFDTHEFCISFSKVMYGVSWTLCQLCSVIFCSWGHNVCIWSSHTKHFIHMVLGHWRSFLALIIITYFINWCLSSRYIGKYFKLWFNPSACLCSSGCGVTGYEQAARVTRNWWRAWLSWCEVEPAAPHHCIPAVHHSIWAPSLCVSTSRVSRIITTTTITSAAPVLPPAAAPHCSAPSAPHPPVMSTVLDACAATRPPASRGLHLCAVHILMHRRAVVVTRPAPKLAVGSPSAPLSWADSFPATLHTLVHLCKSQADQQERKKLARFFFLCLTCTNIVSSLTTATTQYSASQFCTHFLLHFWVGQQDVSNSSHS